MRRRRVLPALLAILAASAAALAQAPGAAQAPTAPPSMSGAALAGQYSGLRWGVYEPGALERAESSTTGLRVGAHPQSRYLGARWDGRYIIVAYRANAPFATVYEYHHEQLTAQGFRRRGGPPSLNAGTVTAVSTYERGNDVVELRLILEENDVYRVRLDLKGVQDDDPPAAADPKPAGDPTSPAAPSARQDVPAAATASGGASSTSGSATDAAVSSSTGSGGAAGTVASDLDRLTRAVNADIGRLRVSVLPDTEQLPEASDTAVFLRPFDGATRTTINFTGSRLFLGYFVRGASLNENFLHFERLLRAQGFTRTDAEGSGTAAGAATAEKKGTYARNDGRVELLVQEYEPGGFRAVVDFDDLASRIR